MPRVALIDTTRAPLLARPYYKDGDPGPIVASLAHVPELLEVAMPFIACVFGPSAIDERTKELVVLRTSAVSQCRYCVQTHTAVALDVGLSSGEIKALRGEATIAGAFADPRELTLLAWVDAVASRGAVEPDVREALRPHFGDADVVELTALCAATLMLNRLCTALDLPTSPAALGKLTAAGLA